MAHAEKNFMHNGRWLKRVEVVLVISKIVFGSLVKLFVEDRHEIMDLIGHGSPLARIDPWGPVF